jgi:inositol transport system substrate-binding protein
MSELFKGGILKCRIKHLIAKIAESNSSSARANKLSTLKKVSPMNPSVARIAAELVSNSATTNVITITAGNLKKHSFIQDSSVQTELSFFCSLVTIKQLKVSSGIFDKLCGKTSKDRRFQDCYSYLMKAVQRLFRITTLISVCLVLIPCLAGCFHQPDHRYALCMSHLSNSFTNTLADAARQRAQELGVELVVLDAQQSVSLQVGQVETLIKDGVAGIMIEPAASEGLEKTLEICRGRGIPVVLVSQRISNDRLASCYIGTDNVECGRLEMGACLDSIRQDGQIVILHGPVGAQAQTSRYRGYLDALDKQPNVQIVAELNADWNADKARLIIANWLSAGKRFDAVVAQNDEMAMGAIEALKTANMLDQVKVFGIDASPQAVLAVKTKEMTATISIQPAEQGRKAVEACVGLANGQEVAAEILVSQLVVKADSLKE